MWNYVLELFRLPVGVRRFLYSEPLLGMSFGLFGLLLNLHFLDRGMNEIQIGELTSLQMIVMGITAIPLGMMSDRFGRKWFIVSGLFLIGLSYFFIAEGSTFLQYALAQTLNAFGLSIMISGEIPLLFSYCSNRREETQTYNMMFAVFTLFTGFGTLAGGILPNWLPSDSGKYALTIEISGFLVLLVGLIRVFLPKEPPRTKHKKADGLLGPVNATAPGKLIGAGKLPSTSKLPSASVWVYIGFSFFAGATFGFLVPYYNVILKFQMNWSDEIVSLVLTLNGFFLFVASFLTPYLLDLWGLRKAALALFGLTITTTLLLVFQMPSLIFTLLFLARSGGYLSAVNLIEGQAMQATPDNERGLASGMRSVARSLASTIAAYLTGFILNMRNYLLPFALTAILLLCAYVYFQTLMARRLEQELAEDA